MLVGNDVVDLADPETSFEDLHPRFDERVFCAAERRALAATPTPHWLRWALWAAKESAFKAAIKLDPQLVCSPRSFVVVLDGAVGRVSHGGRRFDVRIGVDGACLHGVAIADDHGEARLLSATRRLGGVAVEPGAASLAVRQLAIEAAGRALGISATEIEVVGRPPRLRHRGQPLAADLSLSHHGRFVGFACALAGPSLAPSA